MIDSTALPDEELTSFPELMRELCKPLPDSSNEARVPTRWSQVREIGTANLFPILFFVAAVFCACVLKFKLGLWGGYDFIKTHWRTILNVLYLCSMAQLLYQLYAVARFYRNLSVQSASWVQRQYDQERTLARQLVHIPAKALEEYRRRIEMEIDTRKQISLLATLLSAVVALGQLHFGSAPVLQGAVIGIMLVVVCDMRVVRQFSRLAFVLSCAENTYSPRN